MAFTLISSSGNMFCTLRRGTHLWHAEDIVWKLGINHQGFFFAYWTRMFLEQGQSIFYSFIPFPLVLVKCGLIIVHNWEVAFPPSPCPLANSTSGGVHWTVLKHEGWGWCVQLYNVFTIQWEDYLAKLQNAGVPGCLIAEMSHSLNPCILTKRQTQFLYW